MSSPYLIVLSEVEDRVLAARVASGRTEYRDRLRALIVLEAAHGDSNAAIAEALNVCVDTVRTWRRRFATDRLKGLKDRPRSGRPRVHGPGVRAEAVALACALPAENDVPLSRWSCPEIARELAARCHVSVAASSVRRWLAEDALKPWQHRSWISMRDPDFAVKDAAVLDLYAGTWHGKPLGQNDFVICADEKTSIQARCRCHPSLPPGRARTMRVEHDYRRGGAAGLPGSLGRSPRPSGRPVRGHHRDRTVLPAGRSGDDRRTVHIRRPGVLDRGQRVLPPRPYLGRSDAPSLAERAPDPPARARLLA